MSKIYFSHSLALWSSRFVPGLTIHITRESTSFTYIPETRESANFSFLKNHEPWLLSKSWNVIGYKLKTAYNPVGCTLYLYKKNLAQMFTIKLTCSCCSSEGFAVFCCNNYRLRGLLGEEQSQGMKSKHSKGLCYEDAMREAFSEIFQNLREIEKNTEKKRQKMDFERRRGSAPALSLLKEEKTFFRQPAIRRGSAPVLLKSSPTEYIKSPSPKIHLLDDGVNIIVFWRSIRWFWLVFRRWNHRTQNKWKWKAVTELHSCRKISGGEVLKDTSVH